MRIYQRHKWDLSYREAAALQKELRQRIKVRPISLRNIRFVAGTDVAINKSTGQLVAAVVVHEFPSLELVESHTMIGDLTFPYIPGLLSFREIPCLVDCLAKVRLPVDVVICDGQGIAHPRGFGLASHLGLLLRRSTIGCAKSRLVGEHEDVRKKRGSFAQLSYKHRRVGSVLRTQDGIKPLYISPGHLADQAGSRRLVLACSTRYRLPEPTRQADRLAGEKKKRIEEEGSSLPR